jgi:UDP-3-O-[3-hydroxymyristoyl] glucosamine N-acyltransferase
MKTSHRSFALAELTHGLDVTIQGDPDCLVTGITPIQQAQPGHITFLSNPSYRKYLPNTQAAVVILSKENAKDCLVTAVISANPYYTYAKIAEFFDVFPNDSAGIHASTVIGKDCDIHPTVSIAANCVIGDQVKINKNVVIGPGCIIGDHSILDEAVRLDARVTIYHAVEIGKRTRISSGVVIGADGFGFAQQNNSWYKVPQLGGVKIGQDVDIGANTTIDRGALESTIIEDGVKLDNLIQIGHNVKIGAHTIVAGCTGIAGSTTIGKHCMIGGAACITGHITICDHVVITGTTGVSKSIHEPGMYTSGVIGAVPREEFVKNNARFYRLGQLMDRVKALELALNSREK